MVDSVRSASGRRRGRPAARIGPWRDDALRPGSSGRRRTDPPPRPPTERQRPAAASSTPSCRGKVFACNGFRCCLDDQTAATTCGRRAGSTSGAARDAAAWSSTRRYHVPRPGDRPPWQDDTHGYHRSLAPARRSQHVVSLVLRDSVVDHRAGRAAGQRPAGLSRRGCDADHPRAAAPAGGVPRRRLAPAVARRPDPVVQGTPGRRGENRPAKRMSRRCPTS